MKSIAAREDELFARWGAGRRSFHCDGIADESRYAAAPVKLLFLLKEVNDEESGGFDLRKFMRSGGRAQTWDNVTRWTEAIFGLACDEPELPWTDFKSIDKRRRVDALSQIGAVNVKKSAGSHTTNPELLAAAARDDAEYLRTQLGLYTADVTICCGSAVTEAVQNHELLGVPMEYAGWSRTKRGVWYLSTKQHGHVIDFSHPAARVSPNLLLYGLALLRHKTLAFACRSPSRSRSRRATRITNARAPAANALTRTSARSALSNL